MQQIEVKEQVFPTAIPKEPKIADRRTAGSSPGVATLGGQPSAAMRRSSHHVWAWQHPKAVLASRSLPRAQRNNRETFKHDRAIIGKQLQAAASAARKDLACEHGAPAIGKDLQQSGIYQDMELDEVVARA